MADPAPVMNVSLTWDGNLEFTGRAGKHEIGIDGNTYTAPSPMQLMAFAIAGCMAIDLVHILTRGRHTLKALAADFAGARASENPKRFTSVTLHFVVATSAPPAAVERAIELSRTTYCSAWASLRQDTELRVTYEIQPV